MDIGTFPKPTRNAPDEIVNYDQRVPVENGAFLAWGHLTYTRPLTKRQASDYELRPAPDNPDRPRSIREQMKTAVKQVEADRGQAAPKKNAPDRGDRYGEEDSEEWETEDEESDEPNADGGSTEEDDEDSVK